MKEVISEKIIPVTEMRRNFGAITANLSKYKKIILTRGGRPFAVLRPVDSGGKKNLLKTAGAWRGTELDNDALWRKALKKKSRRKAVSL